MKSLLELEETDLEFKFATRATLDNEDLTVCEVPHESLVTALTGYHLKLWVTEMNDGASYYRGVVKCEVTTTEDPNPDAKETRTVFREKVSS